MENKNVRFVSMDKEIASEVDNEILIAIEYDNGESVSESLGKVVHRGHLMFSLPYHNFLKNTESAKEIRKLASDQESFFEWALRKELVHKNSRYNPKFSSTNSSTQFFGGSAILNDNYGILPVITKFSGLLFFFDDFFDNNIDFQDSIGSDTVNKILDHIEETVLNIFTGVYGANEKLTSPYFEQFTVLFNCMLEVYNEIQELVEDYHQKCQYFIRGLKSLIRPYQKWPKWYSEECHTFCRKRSGNYAAFEMILLLNGVTVPDHIRSTLLFEMFFEAGCSALVLNNDVISLKKELSYGEAEENLIFHKATRNINISLQESLDFVANQAVATTLDFMEICELLKERWPKDDDLENCIFLIKSKMDGTLQYNVECPRYGNIRHTLKQVLKSKN